ncbi:MAG: TSUP family transporter [Myxococcales bacterium]|nr:TSUP family transporter [Myxococcales bacterium]
MEVVALLVLGTLAGALTTLAGLGGGLLLTLALALWWDPQRALAVAAPALLLGNLHRLALYRRHLMFRPILPFIGGAVPGALVGGFVAVALPELALRLLLVFAVGLAVARELVMRRPELSARLPWLAHTPGPRAIVPATFAAGVLTATGGGGALILSSLLLAAGFKHERFVVGASMVAVSMHVARISAYGVGGLVDVAVLRDATLVAAAILLGNLLGRRARTHLDDAQSVRITYGVMTACAMLSVLGVA